MLRAAILFGTAATLITELLGAFHLLRRGPVLVAWLILIAIAAVRLRPSIPRPRFRPVETAAAVAIVLIAAAIATAAWISPPNSADAMAYHMPRVVYWAQNASVEFFPTPYFNQVMLGPMAEYLMLHSYLITGGDHFINLLTFAAWLIAVIGASSLAGALGLGSRGQAFSALFAATLPSGILQASGAKNDMLLALWLVLLAYFALRRNWTFAGLAFGLALLTKGTAFLFAPPLLLATVRPIQRRAVLWLAAGVLLIDTPQFVRNLRLSGSPLGCDSAFCDDAFRWRNDRFGWKPTVSNFIRHTTEQLGSRSEHRNRTVYEAGLRLHRALGIDPQDPASTWRWAEYRPPRNANHEADANNRWHLLLALMAAVSAVLKRRRDWIVYAAALASAFLLFCFYLKWQPFMTRLELPLFFLAAPLGAFLLDALRPTCLALLLSLFLLSGSRLPALENWTRPLKGPHSLFHEPRRDAYFNDMAQWNNRRWYLDAVDRVAAMGCDTVTIDITRNQLEYPFQALLRERNPRVRFQHYGPACAAVAIGVDQFRK